MNYSYIFKNASRRAVGPQYCWYFCLAWASQSRPLSAVTPSLARGYLKRSFKILDGHAPPNYGTDAECLCRKVCNFDEKLFNLKELFICQVQGACWDRWEIQEFQQHFYSEVSEEGTFLFLVLMYCGQKCDKSLTRNCWIRVRIIRIVNQKHNLCSLTC